jgi:16S rRNA (cytosine967-C5)-methyltransferase
MVDALWPTLAAGGKLLYATCSIMPEENRQQVDAFLKRHGDAKLLKDEQLLPTSEHDGFYYALLVKKV